MTVGFNAWRRGGGGTSTALKYSSYVGDNSVGWAKRAARPSNTPRCRSISRRVAHNVATPCTSITRITECYLCPVTGPLSAPRTPSSPPPAAAPPACDACTPRLRTRLGVVTHTSAEAGLAEQAFIPMTA